MNQKLTPQGPYAGLEQAVTSDGASQNRQPIAQVDLSESVPLQRIDLTAAARLKCEDLKKNLDDLISEQADNDEEPIQASYALPNSAHFKAAYLGISPDRAEITFELTSAMKYDDQSIKSIGFRHFLNEKRPSEVFLFRGYDDTKEAPSLPSQTDRADVAMYGGAFMANLLFAIPGTLTNSPLAMAASALIAGAIIAKGVIDYRRNEADKVFGSDHIEIVNRFPLDKFLEKSANKEQIIPMLPEIIESDDLFKTAVKQAYERRASLLEGAISKLD